MITKFPRVVSVNGRDGYNIHKVTSFNPENNDFKVHKSIQDKYPDIHLNTDEAFGKPYDICVGVTKMKSKELVSDDSINDSIGYIVEHAAFVMFVWERGYIIPSIFDKETTTIKDKQTFRKRVMDKKKIFTKEEMERIFDDLVKKLISDDLNLEEYVNKRLKDESLVIDDLNLLVIWNTFKHRIQNYSKSGKFKKKYSNNIQIEEATNRILVICEKNQQKYKRDSFAAVYKIYSLILLGKVKLKVGGFSPFRVDIEYVVDRIICDLDFLSTNKTLNRKVKDDFVELSTGLDIFNVLEESDDLEEEQFACNPIPVIYDSSKEFHLYGEKDRPLTPLQASILSKLMEREEEGVDVSGRLESGESSTSYMLVEDKLYVSLSGKFETSEKFDKFYGGFIYVDTGLGKTTIALGLIDQTLYREKDFPLVNRHVKNYADVTLMIVPTKVLDGLKGEIKEYTTLKYAIVSDTVQEDIKKVDILIITHGSLANYSEVLKNYTFKRIFVDEAHNAKNKDTLFAIHLHKLKAKYKWLLSATPQPNSVEELYSYMKFFEIDPFSDLQFWQKTMKHFKDRQETTRIEKFRQTISNCFFANQPKNPVFMGEKEPSYSLPKETVPRTENENKRTGKLETLKDYETFIYAYPLGMTEIVGKLYGNYMKLLTGKTDPKDYNEKIILGKRAELSLLLLHPMSIEFLDKKKQTKDFLDIKEVEELYGKLEKELQGKELATDIEYDIYSNPTHLEYSIDIYPSTKIDQIMKIIDLVDSDKIASGDRIIISASEHRSCAIIYYALKTKYRNRLFTFSDFENMGKSIPQKKRKILLKKYAETKGGILITSDGTIKEGINLEMANHMINVDPDWNMDTFIQKIGRIRRLTQQKNAYVYNLYFVNTFESRKMDLQKEKFKEKKDVGLVT